MNRLPLSLGACILSLLWAPLAWSQAPSGILANTGRFRPTVTVANSYSEKLVRVLVEPAIPADPETGDPATPAVYGLEVVTLPEKISAKVVGTLADASGQSLVDFASLDESTTVGLSAGGFSFSSTLGEARSLRLGPTGSATFVFERQDPVLDSQGEPRLDRNGNEMVRITRMGTLVFQWNHRSRTVTATLSAVIPAGGASEDDGLGSIAASRFTSAAEEGGTVAFANEPVAVGLQFGEASGTRNAFVGGRTVTRVTRVRVDSSDPEMDEFYPVTSVSVAGAADTRAPSLSVRVPSSANAETGEATLSASIVDRPLPTLSESEDAQSPTVTVFVNGADEGVSLGYVDSTGEPLESGALDSRGRGFLTGTIGSDELSEAVNTLVIVASDSEGNQTVLTRKVRGTLNSIGLPGFF
ncbi:MAG: hypothetical protein RLZZ253_1896 [Verrucomicrobiota bacterium]